MGQANRLISNVLVTYLRMALTIGIGLLTTRLLLGMLGTVDYGLFFLLGGGLSLIMLISQALSDAAQRHMAYEIGRDDDTALRQVFCTSVIVYLGLGVVFAVVGLALRPAFLYGLNIPDDRLVAAGWVYDLTLLNMSLSVLATPFLAVFLARQAMVQDAVFAFFTAVAGLIAVMLTPRVHSDHLIGYAILITAARLLFMFLQIARGLLLFPETRFRPKYFQRARLRELFGFAGWNFLGSLAWQLRTQGGNIVLNLFFGPSVNAAYALANQAAMYMTSFSGAITTASRPVVVGLEGRGRHEDVQRMVFSVSKLTLLASSMVALPLIMVPEAALMLWLGKVPPYATVFMVLVMVVIMINQTVAGHAMALAAKGDIGKTVRVTCWITMAPLPVAAVLFATTSLSPPYLLVLYVVATVASSLFRAWYVGRMVEVSLNDWLRRTLAPAAAGIAIGTLVAWPVVLLLGQQTGWVFLGVGVCYSLAIAVGLMFTLNAQEKALGGRFVNRLRRRPA